jgi:hypothetical protein
MMFRKKKTDTGQRRMVHDAKNSRASSYAYYGRSAATDTASDSNRARRQPIPRSKSEILRYAGERFGLIIAIIAGVALLITSVQVSPQPRLVVLNDSAVYRLHPDSTYVAALARSMRSSWTNSNKITINSADIATKLRTAYPEVADASITLPILGQRPVAYVQLTRPSLLLISADGAASVLDEKGRVLAPASQVSNLDSLKLPTVVDQSGLEVQTGQLVLSSSSVSFIESVLFQLSAANVGYSRLVLPPSSQELDVSLSGKPYLVKLNLHAGDTAREQVGGFLATMKHLEAEGTQPSAYIDARLAGRVYYK